jgi:penicillin-binding protein 1C
VKIVRKKLARYLLRSAICGVGLLLFLWYMIPTCSLYREDVSWSTVLRDRHGEIIFVGLAKDDRYRIKTPLEKIHPSMIEATLAYEDEHFFAHPGVNPLSVLRALAGRLQGISRGGGSTLTMQYARLRFDLKTNHIGGKWEQMLRAIQLERHFSKQQILEAYLNSAPYGGNVEGVAAASFRWCHKECVNLNTSESVALVMLPQRPAARMPRAGREELASTMAARHRLLDKLQRSDVMLAEYSWQTQRMPNAIPHLARQLPAGEERQLSIEVSVQRRAEETVRDYLMRQKELGVTNASVMILDAPTREVLTYVGSADFFNDQIEGQNDGVKARRSPGSLYKPFLYGLALDQGLIHPNSLLADAPLHFRDYNPENNERDFLGPVKAADALKRSRNLPAIRLMNQVQGGGLYDYLQSAGLRLDHPASHYGLSLTLGSAPASLEEIAQLYASLAADGLPEPLQYYLPATNSNNSAKSPLLSAAARWLLCDMLIDGVRDPLLNHSSSNGEISIKTGTSQGYHDAWAAGISGRYVIVVWLGNFDNRSNSALKGRTMAAPLLKQLFATCQLTQKLPPPPAGVSRASLCAVSGMIPCQYCQHQQQAWFIEGVSPIVPCDLHRQIWINQRTGKRVASNARDPDVKAEVWEFWSQEFLDLFRQAGLPRRAIPSSDEVVLAQADAPRITSPMNGNVYEIEQSTRESGLICKADAAPGVNRLFWFANGKFLASTAAGESYVWHEAEGNCQIHLMDDRGLSTSVKVNVERK